jgi:hypothetical protein
VLGVLGRTAPSLRADPVPQRRDRRVRPLDVPGRPLQARDRAQPERLEPRPHRLGVPALAPRSSLVSTSVEALRRFDVLKWLLSMQKARKSGLDNLGNLCEGSDPVTKWYKPVGGRRHSGAAPDRVPASESNRLSISLGERP